MLKVVHRVGPQQTAAFEEALSAMLEVAKRNRGWLGADVHKPQSEEEVPTPGEWQIVLRFETESDLRAWRESNVGSKMRARLKALTIGAPHVERVHGLEAWFSLPYRKHVKPAPKWKMAAITSLAIYPLILLLPEMLSPLVGEAPPWLASLASVAIAIPLMTWVVMPAMTRLFRDWLYEDSFDNSHQQG